MCSILYWPGGSVINGGGGEGEGEVELVQHLDQPVPGQAGEEGEEGGGEGEGEGGQVVEQVQDRELKNGAVCVLPDPTASKCAKVW